MLNHNDHLTQRKRWLECQNQAGYTPFSTELKVCQNSDKKWWTNCGYERFTHTSRLFHRPKNRKKYQTGVKKESKEKLLAIWTVINEDLVKSIIYLKFCFFSLIQAFPRKHVWKNSGLTQVQQISPVFVDSFISWLKTDVKTLESNGLVTRVNTVCTVDVTWRKKSTPDFFVRQIQATPYLLITTSDSKCWESVLLISVNHVLDYSYIWTSKGSFFFNIKKLRNSSTKIESTWHHKES